MTPSIFKKMLRILGPIMTFKGDQAKYFLNEKNGGW
jgi:hypothetical protein